ncbi:MAG: transaldolase family protein [Ilumatobacteraceae bacterium]
MTSPSYGGPLHETVATTPTQYLNDSCSIEELTYAIENGAVGATSNPVIVGNVLKKEMHLWSDRIHQVIADNPTWSETQVAWQIYEELAVAGSKLLLPEFEAAAHQRGRMSIQTDPAAYNNPAAMLEQSVYFAGLAPNMQLKVPATSAGIGVVEELTFQGVNVNVTVSFNVPQVLAIGDAVEKGLQRRKAAGLDVAGMAPYATMMVGRLDDWMKVVVARDSIDIDPEYLEWAGVACFKKAYDLYRERGYRTRLLSAAYRNSLHWTEFVGGEISMTIPYEWQVKFNDSDVRPDPSAMSKPVDPTIVDALYTKIPDFRRSFDADGMTVAEFDTFGPTLRTLRSFIEAWHSFVATIRDFMLPNPD